MLTINNLRIKTQKLKKSLYQKRKKLRPGSCPHETECNKLKRTTLILNSYLIGQCDFNVQIICLATI